MFENILQKIVQLIFVPKIIRCEKYIGYKLIFPYIPKNYIDGYVSWDETKTWTKYGLPLERGANYFTMGKIINGVSSRFDRSAIVYQSWIGGYIVKLVSKETWTMEDHFELAVADQNSWLRTYGDPKAMTKDFQMNPIGTIKNGPYTGTLYEGGCITHSDVGIGYNKIRFQHLAGLAALFNVSNKNLFLKGNMMRPATDIGSYETLKLHGYAIVFDVEEKVKIVLYANGTTETFAGLKNELLKAMQSCEIIKVYDKI